MKKELKIDEAFIRAHLPKETADQPIYFFHGMYLDGLSVMAEGERGREDRVIYKAENEEDLKYWQLETVCRFLKDRNPPERKKWRYERDHAENGQALLNRFCAICILPFPKTDGKRRPKNVSAS